MSDTGWLIVALFAGIGFSVFWMKRELWIHRRRRRRREERDARDR